MIKYLLCTDQLYLLYPNTIITISSKVATIGCICSMFIYVHSVTLFQGRVLQMTLGRDLDTYNCEEFIQAGLAEKLNCPVNWESVLTFNK